MMTTRLVTKVLLVLFSLLLLLLPGCAHFLSPEIGAVARPEARIDLAESGVLATKDLQLDYTFTETGDTLNLAGNIAFDRSVTDTFGVLTRLYVKMNFLDDQGRVLDTVDITPLYSYQSTVPDRLPIKCSSVRPTGTVAVAFNYYGEFQGSGDKMGGDKWEIFYFPFD